jgi:hypothetical protein
MLGKATFPLFKKCSAKELPLLMIRLKGARVGAELQSWRYLLSCDLAWVDKDL